MNKLQTTIGVCALTIVMWAAAAEAQRMNMSGMRGVVASASTEVPGGGDQMVFGVPGDRVLLLTQVCFAAGGMTHTGNSFGRIVSGPSVCTQYTPGIALQPNEILTCGNGNGVAAACMITGLLGVPRPQPS